MRAQPTRNHLNRSFGAALASAAAFAVAAPAAAQVYDSARDADPVLDEVIVTGPMTPDGPASLSRVISLRDLDLAWPEDREVLRIRIRDTARGLCRALGEDASGPSPLIPRCEDRAIRNVRPQVRLAIDQAYARARYAALDVPYRPYPY